MLSSRVTKAQLQALGAGSTVAALGGGLVGGMAQALIMTPCGMVFTSLNVQQQTTKPSDTTTTTTAWSVTRRLVEDRGVAGLYTGFRPMALRQASNWASRAGLTEVARSVWGLQQYGLVGEIGSGILGGLGSCWNTPIETIRVLVQRDVSQGVHPIPTMAEYWTDICHHHGIPGLFRGITPRACQAIWQTCFMVVVPNVMGI